MIGQNELKKSHSKDFFNFFGTYKEVSQITDIATTHTSRLS